MRAPNRLVLAILGVVAIVVAGVATGVVAVARVLDPPSPTTTVQADDGSEVVLDWADFPADAWTDPQDVLAAPRAEDVEAVGEAELEALEAAVEPVAPGLEWALQIPEDTSFEPMPPSGGNGYGGATLHWLYNSPEDIGDGLGAGADWAAIGAALDDELAALGYDPIAWDHEREPYDHETQADRDEQVVAQYGSLDPEAMWMWSGMAQRGSMWVSVTIWDERRGTTPDGAWTSSESGVSLFIGGTIVSEADEDAYADGVAPFDGLMRPASTHSD